MHTLRSPIPDASKPAEHASFGAQIGAGVLALVVSLANVTSLAALPCSPADPTVVPSGTVLNSVASDTLNEILGLTATPPFLEGSTSYVLTNSQPFITVRTFVYDPSRPQSGAVGSYTMPLAQLRGMTREQYLDFWALPNLPNTTRNNAIALVVFPAGTQFWSGPTGPITDPVTHVFWGNGGGLQYYAGWQVLSRYQIPVTNYMLPTPDNGGPVLAYEPRLSGNAGAIGRYLDQRCVTAYSDFDRVLTSLDVLNLANPADAAPLAAAVRQLSPDRYGALPFVIGRQHTLILDAFGERLDATRWSSSGAQVSQRRISRNVMAWGRMLGDLGERDTSSMMPGYRTNSVGGLAGAGYNDGRGSVIGISGGYMSSSVTWTDGASSGNVGTGVLGTYGSATIGPLLIDGLVTGTYSLVNANREIAIPDGGLGIPGLSTAISRTANGTTQATGVATRLDFGTNLRAKSVEVKPFVGVSYDRQDRHGFTEANADSINLTVARSISDSLRSRVGAVARYELKSASALAWALQGSFVWTHRLSASPGDITAAFAGQPDSFTISAGQDDRNSLQTGIAAIGVSPSGNVFARYDGDFRPAFQAHTVAIGVDLRF